MAQDEPSERLAYSFSSVATATASSRWVNFRRAVVATPIEIERMGNRWLSPLRFTTYTYPCW